MKFLDFIFGKRTKIENLFFGQMLFIADKKDPTKNYFECRRHFKPKNDDIEIGIDGDITGPTQKQIDFFEKIENNYTGISNSIIVLIENEVRKWQEDFKIIDFEKEFKPVYLIIPRCDTKTNVWQIAFESDHDKNHTFTLTMEDFTAIKILVDG
jgi:hypothetical protein